MGFVFRIILIVGILGGGLYWFFRDSPLLQKHLTSQIQVHGGWPVEYIAVKMIHRGTIGGKEYETPHIMEAYESAIAAKFYNSVKGNQTLLSQQEFIALEKAALSTYWVEGLDRNNDNRVAADEWNVNDPFIIHNTDTDKDGFISTDEYWTTIEREKNRFFKSSDRNRDGNLDIEEYKAAHKRKKTPSKFAQEVDINNNSALDSEELRAAKMEQRIPL